VFIRTCQGARAVFTAGLLVLGIYQAHAEVRLLYASQTRPGEVVVHLQSDGALAASNEEFALSLRSAATPIRASYIKPVAAKPAESALLVCIDRSGSMGQAVIHAVITALRETLVAPPGAQTLPVTVGLISFATNTRHLTRGFTSDPSRVAEAIHALETDTSPNGKTRLNDTLAGALAQLRASNAPFRRLLVISDGSDEGSDIGEGVLIQEALRMRSVSIDAIGLGALATTGAGSLTKLAGATGGQFAFVDDQPALTGAIARFVRNFALGNRYELAFHYNPASDGQLADSPQLIYQGNAFSLRAEVTTVAGAPPFDPPPPPPDPHKNPLEKLLDLIIKFRLQFFGGLAVLLGATAIVVRKQIRHFFVVLLHGGEQSTAHNVPAGEAPTPPPAARRHTRIAHHWPVPGSGQVIAVLEGREGAAQGRCWNLDRARLSIGGASDNDIVLENDDFVSGHHAALKAEDKGLFVTDLGSRNGTLVNGKLMKSATHPLLPGDRIAVGRSVIEVTTPSAGAGPRQT
jgi:hypothetical protein